MVMSAAFAEMSQFDNLQVDLKVTINDMAPNDLIRLLSCILLHGKTKTTNLGLSLVSTIIKKIHVYIVIRPKQKRICFHSARLERVDPVGR